MERRIAALKARLADLRRESIKSDLRLGKILDDLHIEDVTEHDVDNVLDSG